MSNKIGMMKPHSLGLGRNRPRTVPSIVQNLLAVIWWSFIRHSGRHSTIQ